MLIVRSAGVVITPDTDNEAPDVRKGAACELDASAYQIPAMQAR